MTKEIDEAIKELNGVCCGNTAMNWFEKYANNNKCITLKALEAYKANQWQPLKNIPLEIKNNGTLIKLWNKHDAIQCYYSAWWMPREDPIESVYADIGDIDGHFWVLNDDDKQLIEEEENLDNWYYVLIPTPPKEQS